MLRNIRNRMAEYFQRETTPPPINEGSSLHAIATQYPQLYDFIERKYGVRVDVTDRQLSLLEFVNKYRLPPSQVLFMEVQMSERIHAVREVNAHRASELIASRSDLHVLDVREDWEQKLGRLPRSQALSPELLD